MERLFYSTSEQTAFYIPDYYPDGTGSAVIILENLTKELNTFVELTGVDRNTVYTQEILTSRRYKHKSFRAAKFNIKNGFIIDGTYVVLIVE